MEGGVLDLHTRDRREREKEVDGGDFGVENREQGNDLLDDKEGEKIRRATMYALPVAGIGNIEEKHG